MEEITCIQCERTSNHQYPLKCSHYLCSKCLTRALFFTNFKKIAELERIDILCNCQKSKTELKTDEIVGFIQKANDIANLSSLRSIKSITNTNPNTGLQHKLYQSFFNNIVSIEKKYFNECTSDYQRKKKLITDAIFQIAAISKNFKHKFDKAFQRAKRFFMLLKISLYDHYNAPEEELSELIHLDDVEFKSNFNKEYEDISNIYKTLRNQKEFNTRVVMNRIPVFDEDIKDGFKWVFHFKDEKNEVIGDMRLNKSKSSQNIIKMKPNAYIDIDSVILNDHSHTVYQLMKLKEQDIYANRYKILNTEFRWVTKVIDLEYLPQDRVGLLKQISDVTNVNYTPVKSIIKPIEKIIDYHQGECFSFQRLYHKYDKNTISTSSSSTVVELLSNKNKPQSDIYEESTSQIITMSKSRSFIQNNTIQVQENSFEYISSLNKEEKKKLELVYEYDPISKQLVINSEDRVSQENNENDKSKRIENINVKRSSEALTNEELIEFLMATNIFNKSFDQSAITPSACTPIEYIANKNTKMFNESSIKPMNTHEFLIPQKERHTSLQFNHTYLTFNRLNKQYNQSKSINEICYHSNIRHFPLNAFDLQSNNFFITRKPINIPQPSTNSSFTLSSINHFIKDKLLFSNNYSFEFPIDYNSKMQRFRKLIKLNSADLAFSIVSSKSSPLINNEKLSLPLELNTSASNTSKVPSKISPLTNKPEQIPYKINSSSCAFSIPGSTISPLMYKDKAKPYELNSSSSTFSILASKRSPLINKEESTPNELKFSSSSSSTLSKVSSTLSSIIKVEKLKPFELINSIKLHPLQSCSMTQFTIASTKTNLISKESNKSFLSVYDNIIIEPKIESSKSINLFENLSCVMNKNEDETKAIQQYRNDIVRSLSQSSFKFEVTNMKPIEEQRTSTASSMKANYKIPSSPKKPSLVKKSLNKGKQANAIIESSSLINLSKGKDLGLNKKGDQLKKLQGSLDQLKKSKEITDQSNKLLFIKKDNQVRKTTNSVPSNEVLSPKVPIKQVNFETKKFKSMNEIENDEQDEPLLISSKETDIEIDQKGQAFDINKRRTSLTLSLSSESEKMISNMNGYKIEQYNTAAAELAGNINKNKDSSINRSSEDEINLVNNLVQLEINSFNARRPSTPKKKRKHKRHLTVGTKISILEKNLKDHGLSSFFNRDEESDIKTSAVNRSHVFSAHKSILNLNKPMSPSVTKLGKGPSIPKLSLIVPSTNLNTTNNSMNNIGKSPRGARKYSSFCPLDDSTFINEGIKSVCQIDDDTIALCNHDSIEVTIMQHYKENEIEKQKKIALKQHTQQVNMVISIPMQKIASCSADSSIIIWNTQTYQSEKVLVDKTKGDILCVLYINKSIIVSGSFWTIYVWDYEKEVELFNLVGHSKTITSIVKVSEDIVVSSSLDSTTKLWNLKEKKELNTIFGGKTGITVIVSISSKRIGMGMGDFAINIYNTSTLHLIASLRGHTAKIVFLLKLNQNTIASSSKDLSIIIWNLQAMSIVKKFEKRIFIGTCMQLLKNGNILIGTTDSTLEELDIGENSTDNLQEKSN